MVMFCLQKICAMALDQILTRNNDNEMWIMLKTKIVEFKLTIGGCIIIIVVVVDTLHPIILSKVYFSGTNCIVWDAQSWGLFFFVWLFVCFFVHWLTKYAAKFEWKTTNMGICCLWTNVCYFILKLYRAYGGRYIRFILVLKGNNSWNQGILSCLISFQTINDATTRVSLFGPNAGI